MMSKSREELPPPIYYENNAVGEVNQAYTNSNSPLPKYRYQYPISESNPMSSKKMQGLHGAKLPEEEMRKETPLQQYYHNSVAGSYNPNLKEESLSESTIRNDLQVATIIGDGRVIDVPRHQTRRHYRKVAPNSNKPNTLQYDYTPQEKFAGMPYRAPAYNIINGLGPNPKSIINASSQLKQLPGFLKEKYESAYAFEAPMPISNSNYYQNRNAAKSSNPIF